MIYFLDAVDLEFDFDIINIRRADQTVESARNFLRALGIALLGGEDQARARGGLEVPPQLPQAPARLARAQAVVPAPAGRGPKFRRSTLKFKSTLDVLHSDISY